MLDKIQVFTWHMFDTNINSIFLKHYDFLRGATITFMIK